MTFDVSDVCAFICRGNPLYMAGMKEFGNIKTTFSGAKTFNFDISRTPLKILIVEYAKWLYEY